ncbi:MAG: DUF1592 domain-containing protein [Sandaracinaceae bacterium]|nr:DUF1592 domain-containing protein [Sandaracinaceae bacterium]
MRSSLFFLSLLLCAGCAESGLEPLRPTPRAPTPPLSPEEASARYAELCASCHGELGEGGLGPRLVDVAMDHGALSQTIDEAMPANDPSLCRDGCAEGLATFIETRLTSSALACDAVPPAPRRLRLLNRREYAASVVDLLGLDAGGGAAPSCEPTTFRYDPAGRSLTSVHVAGSFNGWDAAAWPMTRTGAQWTLTRALPVGVHEYKLVLDGGEWIPDPANPDRADDGFGGFNSRLDVRCDASAPGGASPTTALDLARDLPLEARDAGYVYDNSANALQVTSVHLDELLRAAQRGLDALGDGGLDALVGCADGRGACAAGFARRFGRRAFRRPLTDAEVVRYQALASEAPDDRAGYAAMVLGMLVSPNFLYRSELGQPVGDGTFRLDGWEMATALSYGLTGTTPDDALLDAAAAGELDEPAGVEAHARRLLDDPRSRAVLAAFARQWLGVEAVPDATRQDPSFDAALGRAMVEETEQFFLHVVFEGTGRFEELLRADYTFVNARLAALYGIDGVTGDALRSAPYPDDRRAGLLAHGSVLSATAHSDQSSPIRRGLFVRRRLLCQEFPPPPPNAGAVPEVDPGASTRERFAQHTASTFCASCHQYIDPVGFGFEGFGPTGRWRDTDDGHPIESSGDMVDVEYLGAHTSAPFETLAELGQILAQSDAAPDCFARQAYRFVRGARETLDERCAVQPIVAGFRERDGDVRELFVSLFTAPDLRIRREAP